MLTVDSPLNDEAAEGLRAAAESAPRLGRPQLVIDLSAAPLLDSVGCEALLDVRDAAVDIGGACCLASPSPLCADVLNVVGLDERFPIFDGVKEAIASFAR